MATREQRERELLELREKGLATHQTDRYKDLTSPLRTPEEARAFLATMRDKIKEANVLHQPPSNLTADSMDAWYLQQKERERELRRRRQEAEALLHTYRMSLSHEKGKLQMQESRSPSMRAGLLASPMDAICEDMEDPESPRRQLKLDREVGRLNRRSSYKADAIILKSRAAAQNGEWNKEEKKDEKDEPDNTKESRRASSGTAISPIPTSIETRRPADGSFAYSNTPTSMPPEPVDTAEDITEWRDFISAEPGSKFPPESGRYHLYASFACPGSHRALIVRALKGLEDCISVSVVHPVWRHTNPDDPEDRHRGWVFGDPGGEAFCNTSGRGGPFPAAFEGNEPDPVFDAYSIRDIYEAAGDNAEKFTLPLLWDKQLNTIVNNESSDIAYMLNSCLNDFAKNPELDLYTEDDEDGMEKLNEVNEWLYPLMIHGVYKCGFAKTQRSYNQAIAELTEAFDRADSVLQRQRFLTGDAVTDADLRLFATLFRFDEVYAFYFKANTRLVMLTPSLLNYCRDIYQMPGVAETCRMDHIKAHFYGSHAEWNKYSIIPEGLGFVKQLELLHDRDEKFPSPTSTSSS